VVHITDTANGKTASCVVADRGPFAAGRILDMDPSVFQQLAPLSAGVIPIVISW
jgi:rare lipoprotein A (peptidoglycan hydrolase)